MEILSLRPVWLLNIKKVIKMARVIIHRSGCMLGRIE